MRNLLKTIAIWLALSVSMLICWMVGMAIGTAIFPNAFMDQSSDSDIGFLSLFLVCVVDAGILYYYLKYSTLKGWKQVSVLFLIGFGFMFFMSQIETLWFNDSLQISLNGIYALLLGGVIMFVLFSAVATLITGKFNTTSPDSYVITQWKLKPVIISTAIISILIWPLLYFLAGYLIAWQFDEVRMLYSGSANMDSFMTMLAGNIRSNLYLFQIFRGVLWVLLALLVLRYLSGNRYQKMTVLVLIFIFPCIQLILPNPVMSDTVRMAHLIETVTENIILGTIIFLMVEKSEVHAGHA